MGRFLPVHVPHKPEFGNKDIGRHRTNPASAACSPQRRPRSPVAGGRRHPLLPSCFLSRVARRPRSAAWPWRCTQTTRPCPTSVRHRCARDVDHARDGRDGHPPRLAAIGRIARSTERLSHSRHGAVLADALSDTRHPQNSCRTLKERKKAFRAFVPFCVFPRLPSAPSARVEACPRAVPCAALPPCRLAGTRGRRCERYIQFAVVAPPSRATQARKQARAAPRLVAQAGCRRSCTTVTRWCGRRS